MSEFSKTYFKVMDILALILGIIMCVTIIGAVFGVPLIIAHNKFKEASEASQDQLIEMRGALFGWGIFSAIAMSGTIFGLVIIIVCASKVDQEIRDLENGVVNDGFSQTIKNVFTPKTNTEKQRDQLVELQKMKDDGLITEEEYENMRKKILGI